MTDTTQAAEPITSATEPAPCEDETQSVYAWSSSEGDDTEIIQRRSWKLPLAAVMLAAAGLAAGITVWPHHSTLGSPAAPPQAAPHSTAPAAPPPPAAPPLSTDEQFLASLRKVGLAPAGDPQVDFDAAHTFCTYLGTGHTPREAVQHFSDENPQLTQQQLAQVINLSQEYYCPNT